MNFICLVLAALLSCAPPTFARKPSDAILLSKVKSLTLRDAELTSHRRVSALPQLTCVGGNACDLYKIDVMRCTNSGSEYEIEDISWTCKANLPSEFKLGSTEVVCEGYDSPEDLYVLKGSCGVEYRLVLTDAGERKYADYVEKEAWRSRESGKGTKSDWIAGVLFWIVFVGIILVIAYSIFFPNRAGNNGGRRAGYGGGYGGGGGGDDGWNDPPPPYTPRAPKSKSTSTRSSGSRQQNHGWQPGFWSGAAAGAAAGYGAGSWNANRNTQQQTNARPGASSWFGGNAAGPSNSGAGPSRSPPTPSSSRQESTGFGGTRRR